jgi:predicted anti-sigma-YlaC factor YlaD
MAHDDTRIVPYLRGELPDRERSAVEAHLAECADCRATADDFRTMLTALAEGAPAPPAMNWGRYQAELREKIGRRSTRRWWPVSVALSGALAGVLVFFAVQDATRDPRTADIGAVEETVIGGQLDLLRQYSLVERLDLLEDLDVIRHLDGLESVRDS